MNSTSSEVRKQQVAFPFHIEGAWMIWLGAEPWFLLLKWTGDIFEAVVDLQSTDMLSKAIGCLLVRYNKIHQYHKIKSCISSGLQQHRHIGTCTVPRVNAKKCLPSPSFLIHTSILTKKWEEKTLPKSMKEVQVFSPEQDSGISIRFH